MLVHFRHHPAGLWRCWETQMRRASFSSPRRGTAGHPCNLSWPRGIELSVRPQTSSPTGSGRPCLADCSVSPCVFVFSSLVIGFCGTSSLLSPGSPWLQSEVRSSPFSISSLWLAVPWATMSAYNAVGARRAVPPAFGRCGYSWFRSRSRCIHNNSVVALRMISRRYSRPGIYEVECDMLGPPPLCVFHLI
jgi:hypothetical protein